MSNNVEERMRQAMKEVRGLVNPAQVRQIVEMGCSVVPANTDVRTILLDVVPGEDGMGHEIYAKSCDEVVEMLSDQADFIEALEQRRRAEFMPNASKCHGIDFELVNNTLIGISRVMGEGK